MTRCKCLLLLLCCSLPAPGYAAIEMELTAGIGGQAVDGYPAEIGIRLYADTVSAAELRISDAIGDTSITLTLDAQQEKRLWVPVLPDPRVPLRVLLSSDGTRVIEKELIFEHDRIPLTLVSRSVPAHRNLAGRRQAAGIRPVIISPRSLPHSFQGYAGVAAIVTDLDSLSGLSAAQYQAFAKYLGGCNILLLAAAEPGVMRRLRDLAGCGASFVRTYPSLSEVPALLRELNSRPAAQPPTAQALLSLQSPAYRGGITGSLVLYLAGYIVFMTLVSWRTQKTRYLLLLPAIVAGAGIFAWSGNGSARLISWAENQSGDSHLRVSSLLLLGGDRRGDTRVTLDAASSLAGIGDAMPDRRALIKAEGSRRELNSRTSLLSPAVYRISAVNRHLPPLSLHLNNGQPEVAARSPTPAGLIRLVWQGQVFELPAMAKDDSWQPGAGRKRNPRAAEEKLLQRRLEFDSPALLLPYDPTRQAVASARVVDNRGWLVIRHQHERDP